MCKAVAPYGVRLVARFAFAGVTAALLAGCADSRQFVGDPLGNPFKTASTDPAPTGSLEPRAAANDMGGRDMAPPPYQPHTAIVSRPLAAPSEAPHRVATYERPAPRETYAAPRATYAAPSGHGTWSSAGGMAIVAANGETASVLAQRYNVPTDALLHANGFTSAAEIRPGTRLVIPVYAAGGSRVAVSEPAPRPRGRERLARAIADRKAKRDAETQAAAEKVAEREEARSKAAKHASEGETMHWRRGPQPARIGEADPKARHQAELESKKRAARQVEIEEAKEARKAAKAETHERKTKVAKTETVKAEVEDSRVPMKPAKMAHEEPAATPRKAQSDPTPTASLPPADEKVASTSGGPEFRWPAHGRIIQGFKSGGNDGINIAVPEGTSVKAAESGVVAYAGSEIKGFGNLVLIRHPNGFVSAYANNGDLEVHRGEQVKRGQTIAKSGQSGNVASPQLHFELRKGSTPVDPTRYLAGL